MFDAIVPFLVKSAVPPIPILLQSNQHLSDALVIGLRRRYSDRILDDYTGARLGWLRDRLKDAMFTEYVPNFVRT